MKRTQLLLDEPTYQALRRKAFESGCSISQVARDILGLVLLENKSTKGLSMKDFTFVGVGESKQGKLSPVSERHDEALSKVIPEWHRVKGRRF